jgi:predicted PurR-regulated permease PerM
VSVLTPTFSKPKQAQVSLTILAAAAAIALLYFGRVFLITVVISAMLAFLLDPMVDFFVRLKLPRGGSTFLVCSIAVTALYFAGLGLYMEAVALSDDLPMYSQRINELVDTATKRVEQFEKGVIAVVVPKRLQEAAAPPEAIPGATVPRKRPRRGVEPAVEQQQPPPIPEVRIRPEPRPLLSYLFSYLQSFYEVLLMTSFVPFLVYFMLAWRDHLRRAFYSFFEDGDLEIARKSWNSVAEGARAFVIGNFVLGVLLGVASSIFFAAVELPYWLLVGPVSGFLSLVPYIGLPLAIVPPVIAALPVYQDLGIYLILSVTVAVLHLLGLNLLYPKLVGARVHLNPLAVTLALMFWGTIWGGIGLLLGIPVTAALKAVCDNVESLRPVGRLLGD